MNIVQKIETGGISRTRTPMLKFRINELLLPKDARHMTHWAVAESKQSATRINATTKSNTSRLSFIERLERFVTVFRRLKSGSRKSEV